MRKRGVTTKGRGCHVLRATAKDPGRVQTVASWACGHRGTDGGGGVSGCGCVW